MQFLIKIIVGGLWLVVAYWCQDRVGGRRIMSYVGSIIVMMYAGAWLGGLLMERLGGRDDWGAALMGFIGGGIFGIFTGWLVGMAAIKYLWAYWLVHLVLAAIMIFLPPLF